MKHLLFCEHFGETEEPSAGAGIIAGCSACGGGGGAPTSCTYITQTPCSELTNEQALGSLLTGILKNTTGTGVLTIAVAGIDYESPLDFSSVFTRNVNDIDLADTGVTPGTYAAADITVDSKGRVLFAANGTAGFNLVVKEKDGSPSLSSINTIEFDQADGFNVTQPSAGIARINITGFVTPGGPDLSLQFNNSGTLGGAPNIFYDTTEFAIKFNDSPSTYNWFLAPDGDNLVLRSNVIIDKSINTFIQLGGVHLSSPTGAAVIFYNTSTAGVNQGVIYDDGDKFHLGLAPFDVSLGSPTKILTWNEDGVGILLEDIEAPLDVLANSDNVAQQWRETAAGTTRVTLVIQPTGSAYLGTTTADPFGLQVDGSLFIQGDTTKKVAVGDVSAALATLHVFSPTNATPGLYVQNTSSTTADLAVFRNGNVNKFVFTKDAQLQIGTSTVQSGSVRLLSSGSVNWTAIQGGDNPSQNIVIKLPVSTTPGVGKGLFVTSFVPGVAQMEWATSGAVSAGGLDTQLQWNNAGALDGTDGFNYDSTGTLPNLQIIPHSSVLSGLQISEIGAGVDQPLVEGAPPLLSLRSADAATYWLLGLFNDSSSDSWGLFINNSGVLIIEPGVGPGSINFNPDSSIEISNTGGVFHNFISSGSTKFGQIQSAAPDTWSLGWSPDGTSGTPILSWTPTDVTISASLTVSGPAQFDGAVSIDGKTTFNAATVNTPVALVDASTIATDASLGNRFRVSSAVDRTLGVPTSPTDGQQCSWTWKNTDSSPHTLTVTTSAGGFRFNGTITSISATAAGKKLKLTAEYDGVDNFWDILGVVNDI